MKKIKVSVAAHADWTALTVAVCGAAPTSYKAGGSPVEGTIQLDTLKAFGGVLAAFVDSNSISLKDIEWEGTYGTAPMSNICLEAYKEMILRGI